MIKAIETRYAGCRFRSRLEARWAVFFDHLGVAWEYEREGYEVGDRLGICEADRWQYLPDFWLPNHGLHAEVKGHLTKSEFYRLLSAAACLSSPSGGCGGGNDLILLGRIPLPNNLSTTPVRMHMHKGTLKVSPFQPLKLDIHEPFKCFMYNNYLADDTGKVIDKPTHLVIDKLLSGLPRLVDGAIADAYAAARSARFEHGEHG